MLNAKLFGENIRALRGKKSLREMEKILQVSASTLSRIERGHRPDVDTFLILMQWTGIDINSYYNSRASESLQKRIHSDVN